MADDPSSKNMLPAYLSSSSAGTFVQCPQKWKFRYIDRLPDPPGRAALLGTFAHAVLEHLFQERPESRTKEKAIAIATSLWPQMDNNPDFIALDLSDAEKIEFKHDCKSAFTGVWQIEKYDPQMVEVESTERDVKVQLGDVPFRGIIDLVHRENGELIVSDFKSGKKPRSARDKEEKMKQVLLYAAALLEADKEAVNKVRLVFIGEKTNVDIESDVTELSLEKPIEELNQTWNELQTACNDGSFETRTSALCEWCPYVLECFNGYKQVIGRYIQGKVRADAPALKLMGLNGYTLTGESLEG